MSEPETVLPLPAAADAALARLLAQWADRYRLADDGAAAAAQVLAAAQVPRAEPIGPFGYDWWRALLAPMEHVLERMVDQMPPPPVPLAPWPLGSAL